MIDPNEKQVLQGDSDAKCVLIATPHTLGIGKNKNACTKQSLKRKKKPSITATVAVHLDPAPRLTDRHHSIVRTRVYPLSVHLGTLLEGY
jgi:hypothetical protein